MVWGLVVSGFGGLRFFGVLGCIGSRSDGSGLQEFTGLQHRARF